MPRRSQPLLSRFHLFSTGDLTDSQRRTSTFWQSHASEVLGAEDYSVEVYRVLVANTAITYIDCSTRIRVWPGEKTPNYQLLAPIDGVIEVAVGKSVYTATPLSPLLTAPSRGERFEASPMRCIVADIAASALKRAALAAHTLVPSHMVITGADAVVIKQRLMQLVIAANRSRGLPGLQAASPATRSTMISAPLRLRVRTLLEAIVAAGRTAVTQSQDADGGLDLPGLSRWVHAHLGDTIRTQDLAAEAGLSTKSLTRALARIGVTPLEFVRSLRLNEAHRLLVDPTDTTTVTNVANAVGFPSLSLFSRTYRRRYGEQPSEMLARMRTQKRKSLS